LAEETTNSFVVRIWLEETTEEGGHATWRGHITHVASGERRHIEDLDQIKTFIAAYLDRIGVPSGWTWQLKRRLKRWRQLLVGRRGTV
jgi:hypothetical protein